MTNETLAPDIRAVVFSDRADRPSALGGSDGPGFGVYIHWPFCQAKCPYCDFNSHVRHGGVDENAFLDAYLKAMDHAAELTGRAAGADRQTVTSIFFGGGTPSLMSAHLVGALLDGVAERWDVDRHVEVSLEANPTSVEADRFEGFRAAGVNRASLGIQALNDRDLKALGRLHSAAEARGAIDIARRSFDRVSFDLIYARAHQTEDEWADELRAALALDCDHLSLYQLTIEAGTPFAALHRAGKLTLPDNARSRALYDLTQEVCTQAGLPGYEISNHARPGEHCRHNLIYWGYGDYAGIGPGAHGRLVEHGKRMATYATAVPEAWRAEVLADGRGWQSVEPLSVRQQADEMVIMGLRLVDGLDLQRLAQLTGARLPSGAVLALDDDGLAVAREGGRYLAATDQGRVLLNEVVLRVSEALTFDAEDSPIRSASHSG